MIKIDIKTSFKLDPSAKLEVECPKCAHFGEQLLSELISRNAFACPGCGAVVTVTGNLLETIRKMRNEFNKS